ncbi:ATP-binding protein [Pseudoduganella sp. GCM10020061]|uniref:ATP-binding protein n=1 Tax=Pseudoduganella sp. GCM10020061 TaxID=3317345 RepID=UPI003628DFE1
MNRLFFRFFILVMLSITAATFVIYFAISRLFGDPLEDIARRQAAAQIFVLEQYVDRASADEWLTRLNKVREVSEANFEIVPLAAARAALPPASLAAFERGELVVLPAERAFYRRVDLKGERYVGSDEEAILALDLPIDIGLALKMEAVRYVIVALALLIPIALWSRSHWKGLQQLSAVADDFGSGNLAARARMRPNDSIYPLAERINAMAGRIEALLEAQRNLLHSVSHEVRTPIARLEFALELLRDAARDPALEKRIAGMEGDLRELNGLVNELLGMTKLDSRPQLDLETVDVKPMLEGLAAALAPAPARLELDLPGNLPAVQADRRLLARALDNLLRNAQKYSDGHVAVSARAAGRQLSVLVEDNGPGIPEAERERIFEPFYRIDRSRDRATGGFGLGLSIVQKAVALHGGSVTIGTSKLGGASFTVVIPVEAGTVSGRG